MMRQISTLLYAEGIRDYGFLTTLVEREIEECVKSLTKEYRILPVVRLSSNPRGKFEERMLAIEQTYGSFNLIIVHQDADDSSETQVVETRWNPWVERAGDPNIWVPLIPTYMTDCWMLADKEALCDILELNENHYDEVVGRRELENVADPKSMLERLVRQSEVSTMRDIYDLLPSSISREKLISLTSYKIFTKVC